MLKETCCKKKLKKLGVETLIHYPIPPHLQGAYKKLGYHKGSFPVSEKIHREVLSLPIYPDMSFKEAEFVADAVSHCLDSLS